MKDEIIRAQTGDVAIGVEAFERIVEIVGEKNLLDVRAAQHLVFPLGLRHEALRRLPENVRIGGGEAITGKIEKRTSNFQKPSVLSRVVETIHVFKDGTDTLTRLDIRGERLFV